MEQRLKKEDEMYAVVDLSRDQVRSVSGLFPEQRTPLDGALLEVAGKELLLLQKTVPPPTSGGLRGSPVEEKKPGTTDSSVPHEPVAQASQGLEREGNEGVGPASSVTPSAGTPLPKHRGLWW